jgi:hypothetical protein
MGAKVKCCANIWDGFTFADIRVAQPPALKGIYLIRAARRGEPISAVVNQAQYLVDRIAWPLLTRKAVGRLDRLWRIGECDTFYIGSAGTGATSKYTLLGRYGDFAGRHTIMYPLWALLACGWELEYGWNAVHEAAQSERALKQVYHQQHDGKLPALVQR